MTGNITVIKRMCMFIREVVFFGYSLEVCQVLEHCFVLME